MIGIDAHDGDLTRVELTWVEGRTEYWIRFGHEAGTQILDRNRRVVSFGPGSVFAFVRWAANDHGTIISRLDILRAVAPGEGGGRLGRVDRGGVRGRGLVSDRECRCVCRRDVVGLVL